MRWTKSQEQLVKAALRAPEGKGLSLDVVMVQYASGLSTVTRHLIRQSGPELRVRRVCAQSPWDAVVHLADQAGLRPGFGYAGSLRRALTALSRDGAEAMCLLLEDAEFLKPLQMNRLFRLLDGAAQDCGVPTRALLLCRQVEVWRNKANVMEYDWPEFPESITNRLALYRREFINFTRDGMEVLRKPAEIREALETETEERVRAVA